MLAVQYTAQTLQIMQIGFKKGSKRMKATLYHRSGDTRVINKRIGSELQNAKEVDINYIPNTSEYMPSISLTVGDTNDFTLDDYNYLKIGDAPLNAVGWRDKTKYYFVKDIKSVGKSRYIFDLELDSLTTYQYELTHQQFIVDRNSKHFNMYISDNAQYARTYPIMFSQKFGQGFSKIYNYVLSTAGKEV